MMQEGKAVFGEYLSSHDLKELLVMPYPCPFPACTDRKQWNAVNEQDRKAVLEAAEAMRTIPYPVLLATDYMAFARTGNRKIYEDPYFLRRKKLILAALAYCLEEKAEDLDDVINGIWCILEETSWVIPAHNVDSHEGAPSSREKPLPDVFNPMIDLFCAQTGMILSFMMYLTGNALETACPQLVRRVRPEIEKRILVPFETRDDFWWMGFLRKDLCNWTPWILSNVLVTAALNVPERPRLCGIVNRGLRMVDRWLNIVPEDGGCDEGVAYWNMAGGALMDILQLMLELTAGKMDFSNDEKVRSILSFPRKMWLGGAWFANFADCDAKPYVCAERLIYAGRYLKDEALMHFGQTLLGPARQDLSDTPQMWRMLNRLFGRLEKTEGTVEPAEESWLPELQVRLVRRGRITVCGKGGHNGESHNHNDIGSFVVFVDGEPACVDIGNITYTAKTFSSRRYELFNTRSMYHSVPQIGEWEQAAGREYAARHVQMLPDGFTLDMADAYPSDTGVTAAVRTWSLPSENLFELKDEVATLEDRPVTFVLIVREKPETDGNLLMAGNACIEWETDTPAAVGIEEIPVEDARLAKSYPGSLWRIAWTCEPAQKHTFTMMLKPGR